MKNISKTTLKYYALFEENKEGGFTVTIPCLPGCISEGNTFEEARINITEAASAYLESMSIDDSSTKNTSSIIIGSIEVPFSPHLLTK